MSPSGLEMLGRSNQPDIGLHLRPANRFRRNPVEPNARRNCEAVSVPTQLPTTAHRCSNVHVSR